MENVKIKLYDYNDNVSEHEIPVPIEDVVIAVRLVLSGDEVLEVFTKNGETLTYDADTGFRFESFFDEFEFIPPENLFAYFNGREGKEYYCDYVRRTASVNGMKKGETC